MSNFVILGKGFNEIDKEIINKFILFTYIENFPGIKEKNITYFDDVGWGCTIRAGQMMLYNCLRVHIKDIDKINLLRLFNDNENSIFSLHNIVKKGKELFDIKIGSWYGGNSFLKTLKDIFNERYNDIELMIVDGDIVKKKIIGKIKKKKILLCCSVKFGNNNLNINHLNILKKILSFDKNLGFIGGENKSSYYFVGFKDNKLLYLDPHDINTYKEDLDLKLEERIPNRLNEIDYKNIKETMTFCFYLENENKFNELVNILIEVNNIINIINITEEEIKYEDLKFKTEESWEILE